LEFSGFLKGETADSRQWNRLESLEPLKITKNTKIIWN
jgi:hypothetical protein